MSDVFDSYPLTPPLFDVSDIGLPQYSTTMFYQDFQTSPTLRIFKQPKDLSFFQSVTSLQKNKNILTGSYKDENIIVSAKAELIRNGYNGRVLIKCTPQSQKKNSLEKEIHLYRLVNQQNGKLSKLSLDIVDPIEFVSENENDSLFSIECIIMDGSRSKIYRRQNPLANRKDFDLDKVFLKFEAFQYENDVVGNSICESVFSDPILNNATLTNNLSPKMSSPGSSSFDSLSTSVSSSPLSSVSSPLSSVSSPEYFIPKLLFPVASACRLIITEQPEETTYFRNESEIDADKHGHIKAKSDKKKYPTVKLDGYNPGEDVLVTCIPCVKNKKNNTLCIHPYRLVKQDRTSLSDEGVMDPYTCIAKYNEGYKVEIRATFLIPGKNSTYLRNGEPITRKMRKNYELNKACLCFEVFELIDDLNGGKMKGNPIAEKVYSDVIGNQRNSETNKLEIKTISTTEGSAEGGTLAWISCTPVKKDTIKVRFSHGEIADIERVDKQTIIFRTPPFSDADIKTPVTVKVQLERDNALSNEVEFKYMPKERKSLKRSATTSDSTSSDGDEKMVQKKLKIKKVACKRNTKTSRKCEKTSSDDKSDSSNGNSIQCTARNINTECEPTFNEENQTLQDLFELVLTDNNCTQEQTSETPANDPTYVTNMNGILSFLNVSDLLLPNEATDGMELQTYWATQDMLGEGNTGYNSYSLPPV